MRNYIFYILLLLCATVNAQVGKRVLGPTTRVIGLDTINSEVALTVDPQGKLFLVELQQATGTSSFEQYDRASSFPITGDENVLYYARNTQKFHVWNSGASQYLEALEEGVERVLEGQHIDITGTTTRPVVNVVTSDFVSGTAPVRGERLKNIHFNLQTSIGYVIKDVRARVLSASSDLSTLTYDVPFIITQGLDARFVIVDNNFDIQGALDLPNSIVNFSFYDRSPVTNNTGSTFRRRIAYPDVISTPVDPQPTGVPSNYTVYQHTGSAFVVPSNDPNLALDLMINTKIVRGGPGVGSETVTNIVDNGSSFTFTNESGVETTINLPSGGNGSGNPNVVIPTTVSDITSAGPNAILEFQSDIRLQADFIPPMNQTWVFETGTLFVDGHRLSGNDTKPITNGSTLAIDASTGTIDGTWQRPEYLFMEAFGVKPDGEIYTTGSINNGSNTLTVTGANFDASYIGKFISVKGARSDFSDTDIGQKSIVGTITNVIDNETVEISVTASATVTNQLVWLGTDNGTAGVNALYIQNQDSGTTIMPSGDIFTSVDEFRVGNVASKWKFGEGVDDINVKAFGTRIRVIPNSLQSSRLIEIVDTHRFTWEGGVLIGDHDMHNYSNLPLGGDGEDFNIGLWVYSAAYDTTIKNLEIIKFDGTGLTTSGSLQFTNYIQGANYASGQEVSDMTYGSVDPVTGQPTADVNAKFAYTTNLIDISTQQFENTRVANPTREGMRHYSFSGGSFAGWSGLKSPRYWAFYYDDAGTYLGEEKGQSGEQRFYSIYKYRDNVKYVRILVERPDDLAEINTQVRAPLNPVGLLLHKVNIYDCLAHGFSNLASGTTVQFGKYARIGQVKQVMEEILKISEEPHKILLFNTASFGTMPMAM